MTDNQDIRDALKSASQIRGEISRISRATGVVPSTVTRWISGGDIPLPMEKLLRLYFFDIMPFDIVGERMLENALTFSEEQWKVICILAKRHGITPSAWIAEKIREYLS